MSCEREGLQTPEQVFVALGGNQGDVLAHFRAALDSLEACGMAQTLAASAVYRTAALLPEASTPPPSQPDYWNAVCCFSSHWSAADVLAQLQILERAAGRIRHHRWGPRPLDLDLLLYGQQTYQRPDMTVPHPGLTQRVFVLRPLHDLAPFWRVPPHGSTVRQLLEALGDPWAGILDVHDAWR